MTSVYSQEFQFGSGQMWGTRTDVANSTPRVFGVLQEMGLSFKGDIKPLHGQFEYAIALARGKTSIEIKPKFAQIQGELFNDLFFGATLTTAGSILVTVPPESHIAAATVTVGQGTAFLSDLGVYYNSNGVQLIYTPSATPATVGTYSTTASGQYHFNATDVSASASVQLGYTYFSTGVGNEIALANPRMGTTPTFQVTTNFIFDNRQATFTFFNCVSGELSMPTKLDDWMMNDFTIQASANAAGNIGQLSFGT